MDNAFGRSDTATEFAINALSPSSASRWNAAVFDCIDHIVELPFGPMATETVPTRSPDIPKRIAKFEKAVMRAPEHTTTALNRLRHAMA